MKTSIINFKYVKPLLPNEKSIVFSSYLVFHCMDCYELCLLTTFLPPNVWVSHTKKLFSSLQTPNGCATSPFSSDITYLGLSHAPQREEFSLTRLPPLQMSIPTPRPAMLLTIAYDVGVSLIPSSLSIIC